MAHTSYNESMSYQGKWITYKANVVNAVKTRQKITALKSISTNIVIKEKGVLKFAGACLYKPSLLDPSN